MAWRWKKTTLRRRPEKEAKKKEFMCGFLGRKRRRGNQHVHAAVFDTL
jgi:hypothetical protein